MQPGTEPVTSSTGSIASSAPSQTESASNLSETDVDAALQRAASEALGEREGTIIVMDPQNGRLRAVVNLRLAFEQAFPPGSAIKPFTALTALQAGLIDGESRIACREHYTHGHFMISCSHPKSRMAFDLPHALAYSCNFYFATLSERLSQGSFDKTLTSFGFGARTGVNGANESSGELPKSEWRLEAGLGDSSQLLVTPIQLLVAYSTLFNGGHRYRPQQAGPPGFLPHELTRLSISPLHRAILAEGMRGAIRYGTAANSHLGLLPLHVFGKTGTSTASNAFRTQGWFVGLAADQNEVVHSPNTISLAVLVFLKKSHGAECAGTAQPIFVEYVKCLERPVSWQQPGLQRSDLQIRELQKDRMPRTALAIRLHWRRENAIRTVSLEEYLRGVLAAEASIEDQSEALKAQAVISRTFALKNIGRHANAGYDFCITTHCQRFEVNEANKQGRSEKARLRAIAETAGEVLTDEKGQWVDAYFHAACGGMTADIGTLWGTKPPSYLLGVHDDFCATMPHRSWKQTIPATSLLRALRSDPGTDVGPQLNNVAVIQHDATGRAEVIALEGNRRRLVRGWDFKLIVGRSLGWNILKSSRFDVIRSGEGFTFYGSGFGHGLGLCQEGAHVMARRGASYRQILNFYFPNVRLGNDSIRDNTTTLAQGGTTRVSGDGSVIAPLQSVSGHLTLSSEHFRVTYPAGTELSEIERVLNILELARNDLLNRLALASLTLSEPSQLKVVIHQTTQSFVAATGQPGWIAAATRGWRIQLQPLRVLRRLGTLTATLRHEYTHAVIEVLSRGHAARWMAEGLAVHVAGEGDMLSRSPRITELPLDELEHRLASPASREDMRALYAAAYQRVRALISAEGEATVWRQLAGS